MILVSALQQIVKLRGIKRKPITKRNWNMLQAFRHLERLRNILRREQKLQKLHVDIKLGLQQLNSLFFVHLLYISGITDCWVVPVNVQTITQKPHLRIYNNTFLQKKKKLQHFLKK